MTDLTQRLTVELPGGICSGNSGVQAGQGISNQSAERVEWPLQVDYNPAAVLEFQSPTREGQQRTSSVRPRKREEKTNYRS